MAIPIDLLLNARQRRGLDDQIDRMPEHLRQLTLEVLEASQMCQALLGPRQQSYGNIDVGFIARLIAGCRSEQRKAYHAERLQLGRVSL